MNVKEMKPVLFIKSKLLFFIVFAFVLVIFSCKKKEQYPIEPYIEFIDFTQIKNAQGIDQSGILRFSFTDGDGDIGHGDADTSKNFFVNYYEVQNGVVKMLPFPNNSKIPIITPEGNNKSIKGEIEMKLITNNPLSPYDTIMFDAKIVDNALHVSNTIQTNYIVLKKH